VARVRANSSQIIFAPKIIFARSPVRPVTVVCVRVHRKLSSRKILKIRKLRSPVCSNLFFILARKRRGRHRCGRRGSCVRVRGSQIVFHPVLIIHLYNTDKEERTPSKHRAAPITVDNGYGNVHLLRSLIKSLSSSSSSSSSFQRRAQPPLARFCSRIKKSDWRSTPC